MVPTAEKLNTGLAEVRQRAEHHLRMLGDAHFTAPELNMRIHRMRAAVHGKVSAVVHALLLSCLHLINVASSHICRALRAPRPATALATTVLPATGCVRRDTDSAHHRKKATTRPNFVDKLRTRCGLPLAYARGLLPCMVRTACGDGRCH